MGDMFDSINRNYDLYEDEDCFNLWRTRDGNIIPVEKMTDIHLKNTINMLKRNIREMDDSPYSINLKNDSDAFDGFGLLDYRNHLLNWINALKKEQRRRNK